ncbi:anthranilate synthase component II [Alcaligenes sp. HPC1271]|nr:anthranilate synthase component II [Alcaligenes sp. HPC1271]
MPSPFNVTRYHSLAIERDSLPDCLEVTAQTEDGEIMGVRHRELPIYGVQFHPESVLSEHGHALLKNFLDL